MLTYLRVKNFAIIDELELEFPEGMICLTGETGAGKSILIDSLELVLGARADAAMVGDRGERGEITAIFDLANLPAVRAWLIEQGLDSEDECVLHRIVTRDGHSRSSINGHPCVQQTLRILGKFLIDIHGQHEYQALFSRGYQLELLDAFGENDDLVKEIRQRYEDWLTHRQKLLELENRHEEGPQRTEWLRYQWQELAPLKLTSEYLEELRTEQRRLSGAESYLANLTEALGVLVDGEEHTAIQALYKIQRYLEEGSKLNPELNVGLELVQNNLTQLEDLAWSLRQHLRASNLNQERQAEVEEELTQIYTLARKHRVEPEELAVVREQLHGQLLEVEQLSNRLVEQRTQVAVAEQAYCKVADQLTARRQAAAEQLSQLVTAKLQLLAMVGGSFRVELSSNSGQEFSVRGMEQAEFWVTTNPGRPLQPLKKVASGGELSRISLAIQTITAEQQVVPTLIFDEVDAGIGGSTADIVGGLLRSLARNAQVITITHLPQIAAQGQHHLQISKITEEGRAITQLKVLNREERIRELARMLGGVKITSRTLAHAEELLNAAW